MLTQTQKTEVFHQLHIPGQPLVLFNIWDAGSAKAVAKAGAKAIATGSWSVAAANGTPRRSVEIMSAFHQCPHRHLLAELCER